MDDQWRSNLPGAASLPDGLGLLIHATRDPSDLHELKGFGKKVSLPTAQIY